MPIICLEGASAVGKSTTANFLESSYGFIRIPEVNELFARPSNETPTWYLEKQIERWKLANETSSYGKIAVLDGDVFQPLWYNWIYANRQPINEVIDFYFNALKNNYIRFPDRYFILTTSENELRVRKESDETRTRKNFEQHLSLIKPQIEYFHNIKKEHGDYISYIDSTDVESVAKKILDSIKTYIPEINQVQVFNKQVKFITSDA